MTVKELYEIVKEMVEKGYGELFVMSGGESCPDDIATDAGLDKKDNFFIWWD